MGKVYSSMKHPFRNFNLETRAHNVISQPKPKAAPRHNREQDTYERMMKEYPEVYEDSLKKNSELDRHLKSVFVTSQDPNINIKQDTNPYRPLPSDRSQVEPFLYGMKEPDPNNIPVGKATLANVLEFLSKYQGDPKQYNSKKISEEYVLQEETVQNILKYFRVFEVYIPQERRTTKAKFAGPSLPRVQIIKNTRNQLPEPNSKEKPS